MNKGMYLRLALTNIRKNYRFFIPRILCEAGLTACFYIVLTLTLDRRLGNIKGGDYIPFFMLIGTVVIALLSVILMLYVSGFLMRQRKKEYGLYTVLGMEKKNANRVLLLESAVSSLAAVAPGLGFGILMYKLCSLLIARLLQAEIVLGFYYIKVATVIPAGVFFLLIDFLAFLLNDRDVRRTKTSQLLKASRMGEREPKVKRVILILGVLCLTMGYWISIATEDPLEALLLFFAAVILVIIGTYCLMTAGSVFVLKALKNNRRFYYKKRNMTTVSGLLFRMKQNAVGLASIAILATGVLVMTSTTFCLYTGMEDVLKQNYPYDVTLDARCGTEVNGSPVCIPSETVAELIAEKAPEHGLTVETLTEINSLDVNFGVDGTVFTMDWQAQTGFEAIADCCFITEQQYMALGGEKLELAPGEAAVCAYNGKAWGEAFELDGRKFSVVKQLTFFPFSKGNIVVNAYGFVLADEEDLNTVYELQKAGYDAAASELSHRVCVNFTADSPVYERGEAFLREVQNGLKDAYCENNVWFCSADAVWQGRESLYGMYGCLLFLGIILGIVCLFATALIIYYKQISEGYEDRERFVIMQKIGMSGKEVRLTVRRQILMVFFLPLIVAGVHMIFACPILTRLLKILLLTSTWAFVKWILISYAAFAAVYALIYALTARTYYKIVS